MGKINYVNTNKDGFQFFINIPNELDDCEKMIAWFEKTNAIILNTLSRFNGIAMDEDEDGVNIIYATKNATYGIVDNHDDDYAVSITPREGCEEYLLRKETLSLIYALEHAGILISTWDGDYSTKELKPVEDLYYPEIHSLMNNTAFKNSNSETFVCA